MGARPPRRARPLVRVAATRRPTGRPVPANADHPAHTVAAELAAELLAEPPPDPVAENVLAPEDYAVVLDELGFGDQHVRLQVYVHHLRSTREVVEWVKGTTLTRFKEPFGQEAGTGSWTSTAPACSRPRRPLAVPLPLQADPALGQVLLTPDKRT